MGKDEGIGFVKWDSQSPQDLHIANAYKDPEFLEDALKLSPDLLNMGPLDRLKYASNLPKVKLETVARKYAIKSEDVLFYLCGNAKSGFYRNENDYLISLSKVDDNHASAVIDLDITKQEFLKLWTKIAELKRIRGGGKISKNKPPIYDKLLYAIFKSLRRGLTFGEIYTSYRQGKLPYYKNGAISILSEQKLKEYYDKFGPKENQ